MDIGSIAALASGLGSLASGFGFGGGGSDLDLKKSWKLIRTQNKENFEWSRRYEREVTTPIRNQMLWQQRYYDLRKIQDTVADARAAGVHPLYAMGAVGAGSYGGAAVGGGPSFGASAAAYDVDGIDPLAISDGVEKVTRAVAPQDPVHREMVELGLAEKRETLKQTKLDTQLRELQLHNAVQEMNSRQDAAALASSFDMIDPGQVPVGKVEPRGNEQFSRNKEKSDERAGSNPAWERKEVSPGNMWKWPAGADPEEIFPWVLSAGATWLENMLQRRDNNRKRNAELRKKYSTGGKF